MTTFLNWVEESIHLLNMPRMEMLNASFDTLLYTTFQTQLEI